MSGYHLTLDGRGTTEATSPSFLVDGLSAGQHLSASVVAYSSTETTGPLHAEVAGATPLQVPDGDISLDFCQANTFLKQGTVDIPCNTLSVLLGHVLTQEGSGVPGLTVSILNHPEFGSTTSQADGLYALAVPAGRWTVDARARSFVPTQRWAVAAARDFSHVDDIVVLRRDEKATVISLATGGLHVATTQTDTDGARATSVFLPAGRKASLQLPDGGTLDTATLTLRATEATVGPRGHAAMPATLPPSTDYTFAADVSADEALAAGATGIAFDGPVAMYAENFLKYPLGAAIPLGVYDATKGTWEGIPDARVVMVLADGRFDTSGDGAADADVPQLPGEAEALKAHYAAGTVLVRSLTSHFSPVDVNPCHRCEGTCETAGDSSPGDSQRDCAQCGSVTHVQNRTLSEFVGVSGTALRLAWHSNRGTQRPQVVTMHLGNLDDGGTPVGVKASHFALDVAGRHLTLERDSTGAGETARLVWDGRDAFGRVVRGSVGAVASFGYGFASVAVVDTLDAGASGESPPHFAQWPRGAGTVLSQSREAAFVARQHHYTLGDWVPRENLGNLGLDVLHGYSATTGTLHLGDGTEVQGQKTGGLVKYIGDTGGPDAGLSSLVYAATDIWAASPGGLYLLRNGVDVLRVNEATGDVRLVSGGAVGFAGDGEDASRARFSGARSIKVDAEGNLYLADIDNSRIRRIDAKTNLVSTVVGNGQVGRPTEGARAVDVALANLGDILPTRDGMLYFLAKGPYTYAVLYRVNPAGFVEAVSMTDGDARLESLTPKQVGFDTANLLAEGPDGSIYVAGIQGGDGMSAILVRRIATDGRVTVVAGLGPGAPSTADFVVARTTMLGPIASMVVGDDGVVYLAEAGNVAYALRPDGIVAIRPDGVLMQVVGGIEGADYRVRPPDGVGTAVPIFSIGRMAMRPDGSLLFSSNTAWGPSLHTVTNVSPKVALIPSRDGAEAYAFDSDGRHLRTVDTLTGRVLWAFSWGANGLEAITDANGDVTVVERDGSGKASALRAADGQRTTLTIDSAGLVTRVVDSEGRAVVEAAWYPTGLLQEWKDANLHATRLEWDVDGRLVTHTDARGAARRYEELQAGVQFTSAEGRVTRYLRAASGDTETQETAFPDGTVSRARYTPGVQRFEAADGTVTDVTMQPEARFGRATEVPGKVVTRLPSGLTSTVTSKRAVTTGNDALTVVTQTDATVVNGKQWTSVYEGANRTLTTTSPLGRVSSLVLDDKLRVAEVRPPGVLAVKYLYDGRGRLSSATQGTRSLAVTYGANGFVDSRTNALAEKAQYVTDTTGRVGKVVPPDAKEVLASYDGVGNLTSVTPAESGAHQFTYNAANLMETYSAPSLPGVGNESVGYDLEQAVKTTGWADGSQSVVTRDAAGRVSRVTSPWWLTDVTYLPTGKVDSVTRGAQSVAWRYDGPLPVRETAAGVSPGVVEWGYNSDFRVNSLTVGGAAVAYGYDDDGLPVQAGDAVLLRSPTTGQLQTETVGSLVTTHTYNGYGEVESLTTARGGATVYSESLTYDDAGRVVTMDEVVGTQATHSVFGYDALGRLTTATANGSAAGNWIYSGNGNRVVDGTKSATFDAQDRLQTHGTRRFTYDALGGRASMTDGAQVTTYVHDGLGALVSVGLPGGVTVSYEYDGLQRRVAKRRSGEVVRRWVYDGQIRVVAEVDASGAVTSRFVYRPGAHSPEYMVRGGVVYRCVSNHLGSVRLVVNSITGEVAQRIDYDAWGNITSDSSPGFQPFGFAGGVYDSDTGLTHFGFRDYDSSTGVWTAKDPMRLRAGLNLYDYARIAPLLRVDPNGLDVQNNGPDPVYIKGEHDEGYCLAPGDTYYGPQDGVYLSDGTIFKTVDDVHAIINPDGSLETFGGPRAGQALNPYTGGMSADGVRQKFFIWRHPDWKEPRADGPRRCQEKGQSQCGP